MTIHTCPHCQALLPYDGATCDCWERKPWIPALLILGIILTAVSAYWAVNRYIRMDRDDLYYI